MSGLQGGHRDPCCDNGRVSGGKAGNEHRYSFPGVDITRKETARYGATDTDSRWSAAVGQVLTQPNTMGVPRGTMMGPVILTSVSPADFCGHGAGSTRANTASAQSINDAQSRGDLS